MQWYVKYLSDFREFVKAFYANAVKAREVNNACKVSTKK